MWTSTLDLDPKRVILTQLLGRFWPGAYFASFAPLRIENLPREPLPSPNWVRVRNRLGGICGSDLHLIYADGSLRIAPAAIPAHRHLYPGHEVVGEVIEVGEGVQRLRVGDRVALQYGPNCLSAGEQIPCRFCASGNYTLCERGSLPGPQPIGGGWSEEMLLHEQQLFPVPPALSDEQAVMIEPMAVALHAVLRSLPRDGDRVLIIGAGTIGLLTLHALRLLAPRIEISVLARYPFQIEQATRMGAHHIIYPRDSYIGIQRATGAQLYRGFLGNQVLTGGYDVIYDTIGHNKTLHHALRWARSKASVILVGVSLHTMHIDLTPLWYREIDLLGSLSHGLEIWPPGSGIQRSTFSIVAELIQQQRLQPENLLTHRYALTDYRQALMTAMSKDKNRAIKVVFDYSLQPPSVVPTVRASAQMHRPPAINSSYHTPSRPLVSTGAPFPSMLAAPPVTEEMPFARYDDAAFDALEDTAKVPAVKGQHKPEDLPPASVAAIQPPTTVATPPPEPETAEVEPPSQEQAEAMMKFHEQDQPCPPEPDPRTEEVLHDDLATAAGPDPTSDESPAQEDDLAGASEPTSMPDEPLTKEDDFIVTPEPISMPNESPTKETESASEEVAEHFVEPLPAPAFDSLEHLSPLEGQYNNSNDEHEHSITDQLAQDRGTQERQIIESEDGKENAKPAGARKPSQKRRQRRRES